MRYAIADLTSMYQRCYMARRRTSSPTVSSRGLQKDSGQPRRATKRGPKRTIVELLATPGADEIELEVPRVCGLHRAAELAD